MDLTQLGLWRPLLQSQLETDWFCALEQAVDAAYELGTVYPPRELVLQAFSLTPPETVRVVILGQDPYHEAGQAMGLAFSVPEGMKLPPSLRNIYAERQMDVGTAPTVSGDLTGWAEQGVLLLNTVLTVAAGKANSHKTFGWERFTDAVISAMAQLPQPIAFVLWGAQAQKKTPLIEASPYPRLIVASPHPSPLSSYRGFFGSRPFSRINRFLEEAGSRPIVW